MLYCGGADTFSVSTRHLLGYLHRIQYNATTAMATTARLPTTPPAMAPAFNLEPDR
jgi:hypothetical protein